jgi:hypothetical protein
VELYGDPPLPSAQVLGCNEVLLERARRAAPVHLLRMPPVRTESGIGAMLSLSSNPPTAAITRSVARRAQDAHTNTPPTTPAHLLTYGSGFLRQDDKTYRIKN